MFTEPYRNAAFHSNMFRESDLAQWLANDDGISFRNTVATLGDNYLLVYQEGRVIAPVTKDFLLRFRYNKHQKYYIDSKKIKAIVETEYRSKSGITSGLLVSGYKEKEDMDVGGAIGFRKSQNRYIRIYYIAHRWLYNEKIKGSSKYKKFPNQVLIESQYDFSKYSRVFIEIFYEMPWILQSSSDDELSGGDRLSISGLLIQSRNQLSRGLFVVMGNRPGYMPGYLLIKPFIKRTMNPWTWEISLPYEFRSSLNSDGDKRISSSVIPQASIRRTYGDKFFNEFHVMPYIRSNKYDNESYGYWYRGSYLFFGFSTGFEFHGESVKISNKNRQLPEGEIRFKAINEINDLWSRKTLTLNILLNLMW
ncbi:MAG: hypothetical protein P9L92_12595 [Candidatus Electryonea clarkiae]|nr:hypothetical protein [Candidatus Electryonea clarkiae]MDP8285047.1 hypothetical protein [Candidatus Electryonea clarkiae]